MTKQFTSVWLRKLSSTFKVHLLMFKPLLPKKLAEPLSVSASVVLPTLLATANAVVAEVVPEPVTERRAYGVVVPMPTLPLLPTTNSVDVAVCVDEPIANSVVKVDLVLALMAS